MTWVAVKLKIDYCVLFVCKNLCVKVGGGGGGGYSPRDPTNTCLCVRLPVPGCVHWWLPWQCAAPRDIWQTVTAIPIYNIGWQRATDLVTTQGDTSNLPYTPKRTHQVAPHPPTPIRKHTLSLSQIQGSLAVMFNQPSLFICITFRLSIWILAHSNTSC